MNEYYSVYSASTGFKFFNTQMQAKSYMSLANDSFLGGITFHKEDTEGSSLLKSDNEKSNHSATIKNLGF